MSALPGSANLMAPMVFLLLLAAVALTLAFVPSWRQSLHWGRGSGSYPVRRSGCFAATSGFVIMAAGVGNEHFRILQSPAGMLLIMLGFLLFIAAGLLDRQRQ